MSLFRWLKRHGETVVPNCPNCKKRIRDGEANYCPYCGKLLLTEIPPLPTSATRKLPPIAVGLTTTAVFVLVVYAGLGLQTFTLGYFSIGGETGYDISIQLHLASGFSNLRLAGSSLRRDRQCCSVEKKKHRPRRARNRISVYLGLRDFHISRLSPGVLDEQ
jgi:hypothetical protein